jgi:hypothetical protein
MITNHTSYNKKLRGDGYGNKQQRLNKQIGRRAKTRKRDDREIEKE